MQFQRFRYSPKPRTLLLAALAALVPTTFVHAQSIGHDPQHSHSTNSTKNLTPEERNLRKLERAQREREQMQARQANFGRISDDDKSELAEAYRTASVDFQAATIELGEVIIRNNLRTEAVVETLNNLGEEWLVKIDNAYKKLVDWRNKGAALYASDPEKYSDIGETLAEMLVKDAQLDRFDHWEEAAKPLIRAGKITDAELWIAAGFAGFANNDYDFAQECWEPLETAGRLPPLERMLLKELDNIRVKWKRELEFREKDKTSDNPLVELRTSKGRIVIELFEDQAPEAVKNFIYLVEHGFYARKAFFRVEKHVCAQSGCEKGDGTGNAGYNIQGEAELPEHRDHFRGSIAVALGSSELTHQLDPDSGGSQFYFSFLPLSHLDGKHAVFGRIVEGIEIMNFFRVMNLSEEEQRKDPNNRPDLIVDSKVIRKRDHVYRPTPIGGRLPR